jgi:hypothetical protein
MNVVFMRRKREIHKADINYETEKKHLDVSKSVLKNGVFINMNKHRGLGVQENGLAETLVKIYRVYWG